VLPDMITCAKGLTNGAVPMGAVFARKHIYDAFMESSAENAIELFHGYTYSAHPVACAAGLAVLDIYKEEGLFENCRNLSKYWEDAVHSLKGIKNVIDLRNTGLIAGIELAPIPGKPTTRAFNAFLKAYEKGLLIRTTGDIIALSPPLIVEKSHIDQMFSMLADILKNLD
jgi:beta-alanine--pyruvate transaminase